MQIPRFLAVATAILVAVACNAPSATPAPSAPVDTPVPTGTPAPTTFPTPSAPEIVKSLAPSVVQIVAVSESAGRSVGTGVVYDSDGHVLTNRHVVQGADAVSVALDDGTVLEGEVFRQDVLIDLAIITVSGLGKPPARFGDSNLLQVGEDVIAIGHALGLPGGPTVSKGVVSALNRTLVDQAGGELTGLVQTDAAINQGNSGGPLVNGAGEVIGINTAKISQGEGVGFAININTAREVADRLISLGPQPPPGFLGVAGEDVSPALASALGLPVTYGFGVTFVGPGAPAQQAGLTTADVIVQMNGTSITGGQALAQFLRQHPAGSEVRIFTWRTTSAGWVPVTLDAVLGEQPSN